MTRLAAFAVALLLLSSSSAWAEKKTNTASARQKSHVTSTRQKSKATAARKKTRRAPAPTPVDAPTQQAAGTTHLQPDVKPVSYQAQPEPTPQQQPPASDAPAEAAPAGEPSLEFDLGLEPAEAVAAAQVDPELERRIGRRRTLLKLHQGLGFAMTAGLVTTTVVGQLQFHDSFRGGGDDRNLLGLHRGLAIGTSALFASVGLLGLLAPEPFEKEFQWDTITVHKIFMAVATAGMLAQVVLGIMATDRYGRLSERDFATAHQVVGYTTLGAVSAGVLTLFF